MKSQISFLAAVVVIAIFGAEVDGETLSDDNGTIISFPHSSASEPLGGHLLSTTKDNEICADNVEPGKGNWIVTGEQDPVTNISWVPSPHGKAIRFDTNAAFLYSVKYQPNIPIAASGADELHIFARALNPSPVGWQMNVPRITVTDETGASVTLEPSQPLIPVDGVTWTAIHAPLKGGHGWIASGGVIDLAHVASVQLDLDTWDQGFVLDIDGLSFVTAGTICAANCPSNCSVHGFCSEVGTCECELGWQGASCYSCAPGFRKRNGACKPARDGHYSQWPNAVSKTNGDAWLRAHHDEVKLLKPKVLVLNFANPSTPTQVESLIDQIISALGEGSRFHGYDREAAPQLLYQSLPIRDLRDGVDGRAPPPAGYPYQNSTLFPRRAPNAGDPSGFDYAKLFSSSFTPYLGFPDPSRPSGYADLCSLVEQGNINELWVVASGDVPDGSMHEVLGAMPVYTRTGNVTRDWNGCAGNGCFGPDVPHCARSLRIGFVNYNRGAGCYLESESHGMEWIATQHVLPALSDWFLTFANLDLNQRYDLPFSSWYTCDSDSCLSYPTQTSVHADIQGSGFDLSPYDARCGNVHFPPNARHAYDQSNPQTVLSTCKNFGRANHRGTNVATEVSSADWSSYDATAPDCQGAFLVWWRQNMPGYHSNRKLNDGQPIKSVWPYLFY